MLLATLADPHRSAGFGIRDWNALFARARRADLEPRLASQLERALPADRPAEVDERIAALRFVADHYDRAIRWEANRIALALRSFEFPVVLLKGAAYVLADLPLGRGRRVSDVDILVPKPELDRVERALRDHGWRQQETDEYDDAYYREWMHELPPLRHQKRGSVLDEHHTILPPTGRAHPDPALLLEASRPLPGSRFHVLCPEDMLLHSAAHLFQDGDLAGGLRDVLDLHLLLADFGSREAGFWNRLVPRAAALGLGRPLFYALRFSQRLFQSAVPPGVVAECAQFAPPRSVGKLMDSLVHTALVPPEGDGTPPSVLTAQFLLYVRSHWLKMPPRMLARHLTHKAVRRWKKRREQRR